MSSSIFIDDEDLSDDEDAIEEIRRIEQQGSGRFSMDIDNLEEEDSKNIYHMLKIKFNILFFLL